MMDFLCKDEVKNLSEPWRRLLNLKFVLLLSSFSLHASTRANRYYFLTLIHENNRVLSSLTAAQSIPWSLVEEPPIYLSPIDYKHFLLSLVLASVAR